MLTARFGPPHAGHYAILVHVQSTAAALSYVQIKPPLPLGEGRLLSEEFLLVLPIWRRGNMLLCLSRVPDHTGSLAPTAP